MTDVPGEANEPLESADVASRNARLARLRSNLGAFGVRVESRERAYVARLAGSAQKGLLGRLTVVVNRLGNGWLYVPVGILIMASDNERRYSVLWACILSAVLAHLICPLLKKSFCRRRPFERDATLLCLSQPLDRYSFPSGHCMSFTTMLVPVSLVFPHVIAFLIPLGLLIAWARLAAAHHYPTDVVAGAALGALVSWPISLVLI